MEVSDWARARSVSRASNCAPLGRLKMAVGDGLDLVAGVAPGCRPAARPPRPAGRAGPSALEATSRLLGALGEDGEGPQLVVADGDQQALGQDEGHRGVGAALARRGAASRVAVMKVAPSPGRAGWRARSRPSPRGSAAPGRARARRPAPPRGSGFEIDPDRVSGQRPVGGDGGIEDDRVRPVRRAPVKSQHAVLHTPKRRALLNGARAGAGQRRRAPARRLRPMGTW